MAAAKTVLAMGIKGFPPGTDPADMPPGAATQDKIEEGAKKSVANAAALGYDMHILFLDHKDAPGSVEQVRGKLKERAWDGVSIGFGLRGMRELTPLFEKLVNTVVRESQNTPVLVFAVTPDTIAESFERNM